MTDNPLQPISRLHLALGANRDRDQGCRAFVDWLQSEAGLRLCLLFLAESGPDTLCLKAASGVDNSLLGDPFPSATDLWEWLHTKTGTLPRGARYTLPILLDSQTIGWLAVISAQTGAALRREQNLLDLALIVFSAHLRSLARCAEVKRLAEERDTQLSHSEERYRYISEMISDYAYSFLVLPDHTLQGEWITDSFVSAFGFNLAEIDARGGWQSMVLEEDLPLVLHHAQKVMSGQSDIAEFRFVTRSGEIRWLRDYAVPVWDEAHSRVIRIYGAAQDITERKRHERKLEAEAMLAQALGETLEFQPLIERLLTAACHAVPAAEKGALSLLDQDGERLEVVAAIGYQNGAVQGFTFPINWGYAGRAFRERCPLLISDVQADDALLQDAQGAKLLEAGALRSAIVIPLVAGDTPLGVLSLESTRPASFTHDDLQILTGFTATASLLIQRARLLQEERQQRQRSESLRHALQAGASLSSNLEFELVLDKLLEALEEVLPFDGASILLVQPEEKQARFYRLRGHENLPPKSRQNVASLTFDLRRNVLLRWMYEHQQPIVIPDVNQNPDWITIKETDYIRSWVSAPVVVNNEVIAFFALDSRTPNFYNANHALLLQAFSGQASLAIQNARLFEKTRQHSENLKAINDMGRALTETFDLTAIYEQVRQSVFALLPDISGVMINLFDSKNQHINCAYCYTDDQVQDVSFIPPIPLGPPGTGTQSHVIHSRKPLVINHFQGQLKKARIHVKIGKKGPPNRSALYVPMLTQGKVTGLIIVQSPQESRFKDEDVELVGLIANTAAVAIENARLFQESRRQSEKLTAVNALGRALAATLDLPALYRTAYHHIHQLMDCDNFGISLYDNEAHTLRLVYLLSDGEEIDVSPFPSLTIDPGAPRTGRAGAILDAQVVFLNDLVQKRRESQGMLVGDEREPQSAVYTPMLVEGKVVGLLELQSYREQAYRQEDADLLHMIANHLGLALQNARLFASTRRSAEETAALLETSLALTSLDLQATLQNIGERAQTLFSADGCRIFLLEPETESLRCVLALGENIAAFSGLKIKLGEGVTGSVAANGQAEIVNDMANDPRSVQVQGTLEEVEAIMFAPLKEGGRTIGVISIRRLGSERPFLLQDLELLKAFASLAASAVYKARLFTEIQLRLHELETLQSVSSALRKARTVEEMLPVFVQHAAQAVGAQAGSIYLLEEATGDWISKGWIDAEGEWINAPAEMRHRPGEGVTGRVGASGEPYITVDWRTDAVNQPLPGEMELLNRSTSSIALPLRAEERVIGVFHIWNQDQHTFSEAEKSLLTAIADMAGNAIQRARLHEETQQRAHQFQALYTIDRAISGSLDPRIAFSVILEQTRAQLQVDAAGVLLFNPNLSSLEYAAGQGFRSRLYEHAFVRLGDGVAGRSALERKTILVDNLKQCDPPFLRPDLLTTERFVSYAVAPLVAKGQIKGVLEVFHRSPLQASSDWLSFFEALAQQAAIAIDSTQLFENLQRAHISLSMAYDATIEGLSRALDLRDKETEGHTQRVTNLTLQLARELALPEEQMVHIRRGALLHDIGKLGVPDSILYKPGPLTEEEWGIMRRHPQAAYEMLLTIEYLHPALDIPRYHHEKWDGTGYPDGLKGNEIPLAARLFAVADVWDALTSDRPYRKALSHQKALDYIREQAGKHFDPRIVEVFLRIVRE
jgi:PAS domain S-box-containing protein